MLKAIMVITLLVSFSNAALATIYLKSPDGTIVSLPCDKVPDPQNSNGFIIKCNGSGREALEKLMELNWELLSPLQPKQSIEEGRFKEEEKDIIQSLILDGYDPLILDSHHSEPHQEDLLAK